VVGRRRHREWSYQFRLQGIGAGIEMTSAHLWLHKNRDVSATSGGRLTLKVRGVYDDDDDDDVDGGGGSSRSRRYELSWMSGWEKIDVTQLVRRPAACTLIVRCASWAAAAAAQCRRAMAARSARRRPFVVVSTAAARPPAERRSRRHLRRCDDGDCCALHQFFVRFSDLGWNFIIQPNGSYVNFCYGSCRG